MRFPKWRTPFYAFKRHATRHPARLIQKIPRGSGNLRLRLFTKRLKTNFGSPRKFETILYDHYSQMPVVMANRWWLTTFPAFLIMGLLGWRLGRLMVLHAWSRANARANKWSESGMPTARRKLKGLVAGAITLPVMLAAVFVGTPLGHVLGIF